MSSKRIKEIFKEAELNEGDLNQYLLSRGINPKFVSRETKISHAKSGTFQKWKSDHKNEEVESEESLVEDALLDKFLSSRGINPKYATRNMKVSHSKSGEFLKWKKDHMFEGVVSEETDKDDILSFDIPLFIRILELAREDVKEDMELHRITERLLSIRNKGVMTMDDYEFIAGLKKLKEELEQMDEVSMSNLSPAMQAHVKRGRTVQVNLGDKTDRPKPSPMKKSQPKKVGFLQKIFAGEQAELEEGRMKDIATDAAETARLKKMSTLDKFRADAGAREKKHDDIEKNSGGMSSAIDRLQKHMNKEDVFQDPQAATQTVFDNGTSTNDTTKGHMSKSARLIKALYKKLNMKEDTYDWEKDDKNQTSPGKKAKEVKEKPDARAILTGGKTLTGDTRDTLEIDPMMKNRPDLNGTVKDDDKSKKNNKINN